MKRTINNPFESLDGYTSLGEVAIRRIMQEEEVLHWDEVSEREAKLLYPATDSFVTTLLRGSCYTSDDLRQVLRIVEELNGDAHDLAKAIYLRHSRGFTAEEIGSELLEGFTASAFGPGSFYSVASEAIDNFSSLLNRDGGDSCWILVIHLPEGYYLIADPG